MRLPAIDTLDLLMPLLRQAEPWLVVTLLAGVVSASAFYLVAGRGFRSLLLYLLVGLVAAPLCQRAATGVNPMPPPLSIGEVNLVAVGVGTWLCLTIARLLRL